MDAKKRARGERQPLLREVPPVPIQEDSSGPAPDDLCHAHEHDTSHPPRTTSVAAKIVATTTSFLVLGAFTFFSLYV
jgi:hypothetical protein